VWIVLECPQFQSGRTAALLVNTIPRRFGATTLAVPGGAKHGQPVLLLPLVRDASLWSAVVVIVLIGEERELRAAAELPGRRVPRHALVLLHQFCSAVVFVGGAAEQPQNSIEQRCFAKPGRRLQLELPAQTPGLPIPWKWPGRHPGDGSDQRRGQVGHLCAEPVEQEPERLERERWIGFARVKRRETLIPVTGREVGVSPIDAESPGSFDPSRGERAVQVQTHPGAVVEPMPAEPFPPLEHDSRPFGCLVGGEQTQRYPSMPLIGFRARRYSRQTGQRSPSGIVGDVTGRDRDLCTLPFHLDA
jgi:hypothetical protein